MAANQYRPHLKCTHAVDARFPRLSYLTSVKDIAARVPDMMFEDDSSDGDSEIDDLERQWIHDHYQSCMQDILAYGAQKEAGGESFGTP